MLITDEKYIELIIMDKVDKMLEDEIFIGPKEEYELRRQELFNKLKQEMESNNYKM